MSDRKIEVPKMPEMTGSPRGAGKGQPSEEEVRLVQSVVEAAGARFAAPHWRLVANLPGRSVFAVAPGVYPHLVALDGTDSGVAWIMEVGTPETVTSPASWGRWRKAAGAGFPLILAVPEGCSEPAERLAIRLGFRAGLLYEYGVGAGEVSFRAQGLAERPAGA